MADLGDTYNAYKANTGDTKYAGFSGRPVHEEGLTDKTLKPKDLVGIYWRVAFLLTSSRMVSPTGHYLAQAQPNAGKRN